MPHLLGRSLTLIALSSVVGLSTFGCRCTHYEIQLQGNDLTETYAVEVELYFSPESDSDRAYGEPITSQLRQTTSKTWFDDKCDVKSTIKDGLSQGNFILPMIAKEDELSTGRIPRKGKRLSEKIKEIYIWSRNNDKKPILIPTESLFRRTFLWFGSTKGIIELEVTGTEIAWKPDRP